MRVFISWSGNRSKAVAHVMDNWLQCVLQAVEPWMSTKDLDRGALWFPDIYEQLGETKIGIVCLTQDNKENPWILFEAGALAKGITTNKVCTFLIDLEPADVKDPLAQFNHTLPIKPSVFALVRTINRALGELALKDSILERVLETYWPNFETQFSEALSQNPPHNQTKPRTEGSMLEEVLYAVRRLDRRMKEVESRTYDKISMESPEHVGGSIMRHTKKHVQNVAADFMMQGMPPNIVEYELQSKFNMSPSTARSIVEEIASARNPIRPE